jgi:hypothetical protein
MLDSTYPANLPTGADAYLGYVDGLWQTYPAVKAQHPKAHVLSMAVFAKDDADGCDVEPGDLTPWQAGPWVRRQLDRGAWRPVVYASVSKIPLVLADLLVAGVGRSQVRLLSAHYGAGKHICGPSTCKFPGVPWCDGTQWTDQATGVHGTKIDESLLLPGFFTPPPPPTGPYEHHTKPGDTWAKIATARNTSIEHLAQVNAAVELLPGQRYLTTNP